ncbi:MAG: hypothetical protein HOB45_05365 [Planctomycetaceae bacterium]|nr:hypothetical protein [Planctomycetaceae bacterium]
MMTQMFSDVVIEKGRAMALHARGCCLFFCAAVVFCASQAVANDGAAGMPKRLAFDGFGFDSDFNHAGVAKALGGLRVQDEKPSQEEGSLEFFVKGPPSSRAGAGVMMAEVGHEMAFLNIAAGVLANRHSLVDGPSGYTSRLSVDFEGGSVAGGLDLKTQMRHAKNHSTVGIEFGPRLQRRFGKGVEFFMKGSAEAVSRYERGGEMTPTGGPLQRPEQVGLSGTVGLAR